MTTALAFSALVWLLSFAVALYYLVRLQEWRIGVVAAAVAVVALVEIATLNGIEASQTTIGGASAADVTAIAVSVITLFAVFVFANTLQRARRDVAAAERTNVAEGSIRPETGDAFLSGDAFLQRFIDAVPDALITIDENGVVEHASQAVQRILGYTAEELIGKNINVLMPEPLAGEHDSYLSAFLETGVSKIIGAGPMEVAGRKKDGSAIPLELAIGETHVDGRTVFVGALRDVSERARIAQSLRLSEEKFAAAFRLNPDTIVIRRAVDGIILDANEKCLALLGCSLEELRRRPVDAFWEDPARRKKFLELLNKNRTVTDFEFDLVSTDGTQHTALVSACFVEFGGEEAVLSITHEITAQKRADDALRQSEEQFSKTFHLNPNGMAITRASDGVILEVNEKSLSFMGYSREDYVGRPATDVWEDPDEREKFLQQMRETGSVEDFEFNFIDKAGNIHAGLLTGSFIEFGGVKAVLTNTRDVTQQKRAEESLKQSEEKFSKAFLMSPDCLILLRASDGVTLEINDQFLQLTGYSREEVIGVSSTDLSWIEREDRETLQRELLENGELNDRETTFRARSGEQFAVLVSGRYIDLDGEKCFLSIVRNVAKQKEAAEHLRQSEERFSKAFLMSPDGLVIVRAADGVALEINDRFLQLTGHDRDEVVGIPSANLRSWVRPEDRETLRRDLEEKGEVNDLETLFRTKTGEHLSVLISASNIELNGEPCILSIIRDVTESRRAERELAKNREMLQALLDAVPLGINVKDHSRRYTFMNPFQAKVYGTVPEEAIGKTPSELVTSAYGASFEESDKQVLETGKALAYFEEATTNAQGETRIWLTTKLLLGQKDSPDAQVLSISLDMTDRKATEDQLRHANKMEAVGHLTGGIAHDFNNLLTAQLGSLQLLSDRTGDDELSHRYIDICLRAVRRGADLTQRLLAFSRKQALNPRPTDINALMGGMTDLLQRTLGAPVEISTSLPKGLWPAQVDEAQLESTILNLAINARDAMPAGGRLSIEASNVRLDRQTVDDEEVAAGDYVQISVGDSGAGIPDEVLGQVFEPFFTTKEIGKGSGLGLSMVYGFVKQSGGHVEIESEVGQGTTIRLYLPRGDALSDAAHNIRASARKLDGDESILIVEDDPDVRAFDVVILERLGYTVRTANDGAAALSMANAMPGLDLLLTDVLLPGGMSGKVIADRVIRRSPGTKVLFVSGFSEPAGAPTHTFGNGAELLPKPYSRDELARKVRDVLDSDGEAPTISTEREPT